MSWLFGKKKERDETRTDEITNAIDVSLDEPILYTVRSVFQGGSNLAEVTKKNLKVTIFNKESNSNVKITNMIKKISRKDIIKVELHCDRFCIAESMSIWYIKTNGKKEHLDIVCELGKMSEYEELFKQLDEKNYKKFLEKSTRKTEKDREKARRDLPWYFDNNKISHIASYNSTEEATQDANAASTCGWMPQGTSTTDGHVNVGRTATEAVLTGGLTLLLGASRTEGKITVTYVRTSQWMEEHNMGTKNKEVPTTTGSIDVITQLERLAKLRDQGILTEEEFKHQKTKIINS